MTFTNKVSVVSPVIFLAFLQTINVNNRTCKIVNVFQNNVSDILKLPIFGIQKNNFNYSEIQWHSLSGNALY
jgi:putative N-acetylmannosamine-6-phosphate epimerase